MADEINVREEDRKDRKYVQSKAVNIKVRNANLEFRREADRQKDLALKDKEVKALVDLEATRVSEHETLGKLSEDWNKEVSETNKDFQKQIDEIYKARAKAVDALNKKHQIKYDAQRDKIKKTCEGIDKSFERLNEKYQNLVINKQGEVKKLLMPFERSGESLTIREMPMGLPKSEIRTQYMVLKNTVDDFLVKSETINNAELAEVVREFVGDLEE